LSTLTAGAAAVERALDEFGEHLRARQQTAPEPVVDARDGVGGVGLRVGGRVGLVG
jgi:hypothetical protein